MIGDPLYSTSTAPQDVNSNGERFVSLNSGNSPPPKMQSGGAGSRYIPLNALAELANCPQHSHLLQSMSNNNNSQAGGMDLNRAINNNR